MARRKRRERRARPVSIQTRPQQYTVEATIAQMGDFAAGANRATGWKRVAAKTIIIVLFLLPFAAYLVFLTLSVWR